MAEIGSARYYAHWVSNWGKDAGKIIYKIILFFCFGQLSSKMYNIYFKDKQYRKIKSKMPREHL